MYYICLLILQFINFSRTLSSFLSSRIYVHICNYFKHYSRNAMIALNQSKFTSIIIIYNKLAHNRFSFLTDICCNNDFDRTVLLLYAYKTSRQIRPRALFFYFPFTHFAVTQFLTYQFSQTPAQLLLNDGLSKIIAPFCFNLVNSLLYLSSDSYKNNTQCEAIQHCFVHSPVLQ